MPEIEYRVRPVTRYVVTRFHSDLDGGGCSTKGEYDNANVAYEVARALCQAERQCMGWPLDDERIRYPVPPEAENAMLVTSGEAEIGVAPAMIEAGADFLESSYLWADELPDRLRAVDFAECFIRAALSRRNSDGG